ncbi:threonine dehydratase [Quadrisphaera granulorum]|uniref:threonine ammonia-lyase n=1 Tax=Quadrisphaera granulorum TaxID=317664 RepID=A0A316AET2_9ACTN|nr:threonine ammonia-lyase [Quadrisphaera granulorum]PWJ56121.1 threonine dehydratase [Quadrisphaera granulorum]SZE94755.1 threonine dehydratase [Quadrisphaera granulorum]
MTPAPSPVPAVGPEDVLAARPVLDGVVRRTPVVRSRALSDLVGGPVHLKLENLQRGGSFKVRGAYVRAARLTSDERRRGLVAASAGNHAQGVAIAARELGAPATVFMPVGASLPKLEATSRYGARVELAGATVDEALVAAHEHVEATGAVLVHPFDHPDVVAGQGTVGLELVEQVAGLRTVLVCLGGGGLLAGTAAALAGAAPGVRVVGVQAAGAAAWPASLVAGHPVVLDRMATMADGIAVARPGDVPFATVSSLLPPADVVTVSEEDVSRALLLLLERAKLVVEPGGAAGVAALLADPTAYEPPVGVVLSGGNVDPLLLMRVIRHGMAAAGRFLALSVRRLPDRPGSLAALLARVAEAGADVIDVGHARTSGRVAVDEAEVDLRLQTQGPAHAERLVEGLRRAGYEVLVS